MTPNRRCPTLPGDVATETRLYLRPLAETPLNCVPGALALAGGGLRFDAVEAILRPASGPATATIVTLDRIKDWAIAEGGLWEQAVSDGLERLARHRQPVAGLSFDRPLLMGVINVTPDSFSDGGDYMELAAAANRAKDLVDAGADILDIGAESTRPGAAPVAADEQLSRLLPVLEQIAGTGVPISVDTRSARVMRGAAAAGAGIINDISGLAHDSNSLAAVAEMEIPVVLVHSRGEPATMQDRVRYDDVVLDVYDALETRLAALASAGIPRRRIIIDPGIGFAKTAAHNLALMARLSLFHGLGAPLLVGLSRKSFIARLSRGEAPKARLPGSLAGALSALDQGAQLLRVHDVAETRQAMEVWRRLREPQDGESLYA